MILPSIRFHLFLMGVLSLLLSCQTPQSEKSAPNIVFILADDLGYYDLSCMGSVYYETPNIDRIARKGFTFSNGYAACQVCSPSRASIMTGKFPARHGITDWLGAKTDTAWRQQNRFTKLLPPDYVPHLPHAELSIAEAFKSSGYSTFFAGKWHLGEKGSYPEDHGFDINKGGYEKGGPYSGGFFSPFNNPKMEDFPEEKGMSLPMKLARETNEFINTHKNQPFFAFLSFYAVHAPIQCSKRKWEKYHEKILEQGIEEEGFEMESRFPIRKNQDNPVYAGLIEHMDEAVGLVLNHLKKLGLEENTIVVFTSDNGGVASGDNYSTSNKPLRGGKGYQWEGGLRVPYLVYVPWLRPKQKSIDAPVIGTDFYPSLLELSNLTFYPEQHLDGQSFVPLLQNKKGKERSLIWHYPHYGNQGGDPSSVIRKNNWKLIQYYEVDSVALYDLDISIVEKENLAGRYPKIADALQQELGQYLKQMNARFPVPDTQFRQELLNQKQIIYQTELKERVEKKRAEMLSPDWQPNKDWWGSFIQDD